MISCRYSSSITFELIVSVFRFVPPAMASKTRGTLGIPYPHPVLAPGSVSTCPLSLSVGRQGIWSYVLERDEARWQHSNSIHEVTQMKVCMDYL